MDQDKFSRNDSIGHGLLPISEPLLKELRRGGAKVNVPLQHKGKSAGTLHLIVQGMPNRGQWGICVSTTWMLNSNWMNLHLGDLVGDVEVQLCTIIQHHRFSHRIALHPSLFAVLFSPTSARRVLDGMNGDVARKFFAFPPLSIPSLCPYPLLPSSHSFATMVIGTYILISAD